MSSEPHQDHAYSEVANDQLNALEAGADAHLYNAVLDTCELIFGAPGEAQAQASAIQTGHGIRFRLPVDGNYPYKVFWSSTARGPRVEAVFPHP